ncbi:juvenile hormone esterase-like [Lutzomyia longipalpis]|uniref:juvenile hormone esterase-like n=1 Tax=Lutzomyia longipalpis TaxID=7200 RepID=UPI0024843EB2|nr:juvenile hormone esterase-like [Lutzomyia longipalpis]
MKFLVLFLIFFDYLISSINSQSFSADFFARLAPSSAEVCAKAGCIRGKVETGRIKPYEAFYGIPYAEPPVGKLRFESPVPYGGWSGYWDATYPRDYCIQKDYYGPPVTEITGSEDCLYLQVYRPIYRKKDTPLPVLVFIHPGAFLVYASTPPYFGPEYFMDNGEVIVVTFNYRLGLLGFLCSGDDAVKGNFGLKDQQLALKWIAANIEYFGGDPNSVTLLGHNVGSASANLHMMNPVSQNLFHRVILMEGNALSSDVYPIDFATQFRKTAKYVGLPEWKTASTYELAYKLKYVDASQLVNALGNLFAYYATPFTPVRPCIEGDWEGAFLTEDPRKLWAEGRVAQKPMILSTVEHPGDIGAMITTNETLLAGFNKNIYKLLPIQMNFNPRYITDVLEFYFGKKDYIDDTNVNYYYKMIGDRFSYYPIIALVKEYLTYANLEENPVYMFELAFKSQYQTIDFLIGKDVNLGVGYFDDLLYLFTQTFIIPPFDANSPEGKMSDVMIRTVVNFVARGEIKEWKRFQSCTASSTPFCDWQVFSRYEKLEPNEVEVSVSNAIDVPMFNFWSKIDNGINALTIDTCS